MACKFRAPANSIITYQPKRSPNLMQTSLVCYQGDHHKQQINYDRNHTLTGKTQQNEHHQLVIYHQLHQNYRVFHQAPY
jgi:hypothetical protein